MMDELSRQRQLQHQFMMKAQDQEMRNRAARQQQNDAVDMGSAESMSTQPRSGTMGSNYDDLPMTHPHDFDIVGEKSDLLQAFELACSQGPISTVHSTVASLPQSPAVLHNGLVIALKAGNTDAATFLLAEGAPILRETAANILTAPLAKQIPLFELLLVNGWTTNTPGYYGSTLLPSVVENISLLRWFLDHGADPNLGPQACYYRKRETITRFRCAYPKWDATTLCGWFMSVRRKSAFRTRHAK
ncbi:hypothetical protein MBLNU459_g4781t1 [Dothideomycetes sp. NU459]